MPSTRHIAIIGAGLAGASAALALRQAGFTVRLYSDRSRQALRDELPATGTAIYFGQPSQLADAQIIPNLYGDRALQHGFSVRAYDANSQPWLAFDTDFRYYRAQAVDVRLRVDDRLDRFLAQGGDFRVQPITPELLDQIAAAHDLTLVATGKPGPAGPAGSGLSELFAVDTERSVYTSPQRHLLTVNAVGLPYERSTFGYRSRAGFRHNLFTAHATEGSIFTGLLQHKDVGDSWVLLGFATPGGDWQQRFAQAQDAGSALAIFQQLFHDYFPEDAAEIDRLQPIASDPHSWLKGAVTPTVHQPLGYTHSGHLVAALGDAAISFDPIAGQGAQSIAIQVAALVRAARQHPGRLDADWIRAQFEAHWQAYGHAASEVTRLFLGDPKYAAHNELLYPVAAASPERGGAAFFRLLSEPGLLLEHQSPADFRRYLEAETGENLDRLLARFRPAAHFAAKECL